MQSDGKRLRKREFAECDVAADGVALALAHDEIFLEHPLHVWEQARAAEEAHVRAELLAPFATRFATSARVRRADGDLVAHPDAGDAGTEAGDYRRCLVARNQWFPHDEAAVPALEVVMQIGAADSAGAELQQHLTRTRLRHVGLLDAQIVFCVNSTSKHRCLHQ